MKPGPFTYHDPRSLDDLYGLIGALENAKILAGGQSLMPMMNMRYVMPDHIIDINGIEELAYLRNGGDALEIGAMVRQRQLLESQAVHEACPLLTEAVRCVGHLQTRSRGTIGGSLCHLDPAAELPAVVAACDAIFAVAGARGERQVAAADWALGYMTPNVEPDEVLTAITVPRWPQPHGYAFVEFARRHGDYPIVGVAALLSCDGEGAIARAAVALSGIDVRPVRLDALERALLGEQPSAKVFSAVAAMAREIDAISDSYVNAAYRKRLASVLVERALALAAARAQEHRADA